MIYRFEIYPNQYHVREESHRERKLRQWFKDDLSIELSHIFELRYFLVETPAEIKEMDRYASEVFTDSVMEILCSSKNPDASTNSLRARGHKAPFLIDIGFRPGVTDNSGQAAMEALKLIPELRELPIKVSSGTMYFVELQKGSQQEFQENFQEKLVWMAYEKLANSLLHKVTVTPFLQYATGERFKNSFFPEVSITAEGAKTVNLLVPDSELLEQNQKNCWALSLSELKHIQEYYKELGRQPSDVEMEIIAQSWSEHCKHKIFAAEIEYKETSLPEGVKALGPILVSGLFKTFIRGMTLKIKEERKLPWLISIFHDNAGIVRFDKYQDVCIKVETHNSPSALDPYGGALTGILGVNRDILGVGIGATPIANTNVFCLAENKYFKDNDITLPMLLKNPDRIKEGVHLGVQDGGNKSGIPTVNGAFVYNKDFVGKPLVFCGTVGALPPVEGGKETANKGQVPGDLIVMAGGRIGKDGIHGATFSSMELVDGVPASVVQIGDPITQKRLGDFLIEARQKGLFSSVTDNGAGGLSSSIGEMAQLTGGAAVYLDRALVKYPGLSPYELMVSESQERMTFSVAKQNIDQFLNLAKKRGVEASVVGHFTDSGKLTIYYNNEVVGDLSLHFLHESLRPMKLQAQVNLESFAKQKTWFQKQVAKPLMPVSLFDSQDVACGHAFDFKKLLLDLLASANIRSHEHMVRRYDHEVKGATIVKPFTGEAAKNYPAPSDAGVIWMKPHGGEADNALAVSSGLAPKVSRFDTYAMAIYALDEAVRNAVCVGANPDEMVLVDNYCWPDPILSEKNPDGPYKLAQLVRATRGIYDLGLDYGMPFVSGKDSMKNDFIGALPDGKDKVKISVPPTLLITALGRVPVMSAITTSEIKTSGSKIYLMGAVGSFLKTALQGHKLAFELEEIYADYEATYPIPLLDGKKQITFYRHFYELLATHAKYIESSHDVSDGGVLVSLAEKMLGTTLGMKIEIPSSVEEKKILGFLFNECPGLIIVSIKNDSEEKFLEDMKKRGLSLEEDYLPLGEVCSNDTLLLKYKNVELMNLKSAECLKSYRAECLKEDESC